MAKGFDKRAKIEVPAEAIQEMQRGYETRIARQKESINRLVNLLHKRTAELSDYMHQEVREAIGEADDANVPTPVQAVPEKYGDNRGLDDPQPNSDLSMSGTQVKELLRIMSERYDLFGEDDTPFTALRGYLRWCAEEADNYQRRIDELRQQQAQNQAAQRKPEDADPTPPWERKGHVAPTVIERETPSQPVDPTVGATETLNDWAGSDQLPPGESRPGTF